MPSLRKLEDGWAVRYRTSPRRGAPFASAGPFATKADAQAESRRIAAKLAAEKAMRVGAVLSPDELVERWRQDRCAQGNDPLWTAKAAARVRGLLRSYKWTALADITPAAISRWKVDGGAPRLGAFLRAVLRWGKENLSQPVSDQTLLALRPPRVRRKPVGCLLSDEEVGAALRAADIIAPNFAALVHCLATYGWRPVSAARAAVRDLSVECITLRVKGGDTIRHPLRADSLARLRSIADGRGPDEPLFVSPETGRAWPLDGRGSISEVIARRLEVAAYNLKRYAISKALEAGLAPQQVAAFTGHRTISQVLRYARTSEQTAAAALDRLATPTV